MNELYEVVCTKRYLDVGLLLEETNESKPKRVLARSTSYGSHFEYGGVDSVVWVKTGVFLTKDEWIEITCDKPTKQILDELGINKNCKNKASMKYELFKKDFYMPRNDIYLLPTFRLVINEPIYARRNFTISFHWLTFHGRLVFMKM